MNNDLFFMSYLIVSSIQMGANIDYAIVIASRYTELRKSMGRRKSIINTMNLSFPTIVTSGTMLAVAGVLIGRMTSDGAIYGIGQCIGRGTLISIFITMFVLPQILLVGDKIIEKTAFIMNMPIRTKTATGLMRVDGVVRGRINGTVTGTVHAIIRGSVSAYVEAGDLTELSEEEYEGLNSGGTLTKLIEQTEGSDSANAEEVTKEQADPKSENTDKEASEHE